MDPYHHLLNLTIDELTLARKEYPSPGLDNVLAIALALRRDTSGGLRGEASPRDQALLAELTRDAEARASMRVFFGSAPPARSDG